MGREAAKISALSSKDLLDKYEYLTGEGLGHKPSVFEKVKFEYSPLGMALPNNTKNKINTNRVDSRKKQDKYLVYNSQHSFVKFKDINEFKELSLDSMYKRLNDFKKRFNRLKTVNPQTDENKILKKLKVLDDARDLFDDLYFIYKDKYNEEKDRLNTKDKKPFYYKKLRLTDDYQYESVEEREQQTSKKPDKKELPKKPTKDDLNEFNEWVNREETGINHNLFQKHFNLWRPSDMLKTIYNTNDRKKNNDLVNVIKSGLSDLKNEIENMGEEEKETEKPNKIVDIVEKFLSLMIEPKEDKD